MPISVVTSRDFISNEVVNLKRIRLNNSTAVAFRKNLTDLNDLVIDIDSTCLCQIIDKSEPDSLIIDNVPVIGSPGFVKGHINHVNPCDYRIVMYIKVGNGWWIKPYYNQPSSAISCDGTWSIRYSTGGNDINATGICVFLIPASYSPPICGGCSIIPTSIYQKALSWKCADRYLLPNVSVVASSDTICKGDTTILTAHGGKNYLWGTSDTTASIRVRPGNSTEYSVSISDGMGGGAIVKKRIIVLPLPEVRIIGLNSIYKDTTISVQLIGEPSGGIFSGKGVSNNIFSPLTAGVGRHEIVYSFIDTNGCKNTVSKVVVVDKTTSVPILSAIDSIQLFPNPTGGLLTIKIDITKYIPSAVMYIVNTNGQTINTTIKQDEMLPGIHYFHFNTNELPNGLYAYVFQAENEMITKKFIVMK